MGGTPCYPGAEKAKAQAANAETQAQLALKAPSRTLGPALTMMHETIVAQTHAKRYRLLPRLAVPLKQTEGGALRGIS